MNCEKVAINNTGQGVQIKGVNEDFVYFLIIFWLAFLLEVEVGGELPAFVVSP